MTGAFSESSWQATALEAVAQKCNSLNAHCEEFANCSDQYVRLNKKQFLITSELIAVF